MRNFWFVCYSTIFVSFATMSGLNASEATMIVFDLSSSMNDNIQGGSKIDVARRSIGSVLSDVQKDKVIGLIVFGRDGSGCNDVHTIYRPRRSQGQRISQSVARLKPTGKTPLSAAILKAAEALDYRNKSGSIVLISDGEDTCGMNPCAIADRLYRDAHDLNISIIGLALTKRERAAVSCIAKGKDGQFYSPLNQAQLKAAIKSSLQVKSNGSGLLLGLKKWGALQY